MTAVGGFGRRSRKVRTPQGRTLANWCKSQLSQAAKADGKWNRKQTAGGVFSGDAAGKGETVG